MPTREEHAAVWMRKQFIKLQSYLDRGYMIFDSEGNRVHHIGEGDDGFYYTLREGDNCRFMLLWYGDADNTIKSIKEELQQLTIATHVKAYKP